MTIAYPPTASRDDPRASRRAWEITAFSLVLLSVVTYCALGAIRLYYMRKAMGPASDEQAYEAAHPGPGGPLVSVKTSGDLSHLARLDSSLHLGYEVAFGAMIVLFVVWMLGVNSQARKAGVPAYFNRSTGFRVWRASLAVSLLLLVLGTIEGGLKPDNTAAIRWAMIYIGARIVVGLIMIWCALSMRAMARYQRERAAARAAEEEDAAAARLLTHSPLGRPTPGFGYSANPYASGQYPTVPAPPHPYGGSAPEVPSWPPRQPYRPNAPAPGSGPLPQRLPSDPPLPWAGRQPPPAV